MKLQEGRGGEIEGLGCLLGHILLLIHSPGSRLSLRLWLQVEPELGVKKCCRLVDISCNNNLPNSTDWHLQIQKACGVANDSCPQERSLGSYCRNKVQTQLTFKTPNATGTFSSHTLRKNKEDKQFPKGYRTRCSASLIIT